MGALRCVDGSVLSVQAVACRDAAGQPYEITLQLARNSVPFAAVGQRCGYHFSELAERVSAARLDPEQAAAWPDPDDRFPGACAGPGSGALPGDHEYFTLRSRDRDDLPGTGELRCVIRSTAVWQGECMGTGYRWEAATRRQHLHHGPQGLAGQHREPETTVLRNTAPEDTEDLGPQVPGPRRTGRNAEPQVGGPEVAGPAQQQGLYARPGQRIWPARRPVGGSGRWHLTRRAFIEAWGDDGVGVRAVLTSAELVAFLDTVLREPENPESPGAGASAGSIPAEGMPATGQVTAGVPAASVASQRVSADGKAVTEPPGTAVPLWRQRGKVPDGTARSRLPALRAQA